jgi:hypothetical protein
VSATLNQNARIQSKLTLQRFESSHKYSVSNRLRLFISREMIAAESTALAQIAE